MKERIFHVEEPPRAEANERTREQERRVKAIQQKLNPALWMGAAETCVEVLSAHGGGRVICQPGVARTRDSALAAAHVRAARIWWQLTRLAAPEAIRAVRAEGRWVRSGHQLCR